MILPRITDASVANVLERALVARLKSEAPLNLADRATFYGGSERGYTDYPTLPGAVQG